MTISIPVWLVAGAVGLFLLVVLVAVALLVALPYITLEYKRRKSRAIRPQPEQIWMQDEDLLYIDSVDGTGVEIIHWERGGSTINRWKDTWPEWEVRLRARVLWYTGVRRPLGDA